VSDRVCPECGSDRWLGKDRERLTTRVHTLECRNDELARENGLVKARLKYAQQDLREVQSILQRKISRQARAIRGMEQKLKALRQPPWAGASLEATAPGVEFDEGAA
jgi:predicted RNase H-like nuclease (RuvC/YqgF family)